MSGVAQYKELTKDGITYVVPFLLYEIVKRYYIWRVKEEGEEEVKVVTHTNMRDIVVHDINLDIVNAIPEVEHAEWLNLDFDRLMVDGGHTGGTIILTLNLRVKNIKKQLHKTLQIQFKNGKEEENEQQST